MVDRGLDPRRVEDDPRVRQLTVEGRLPVAADRLAHGGERVAGDPLDVGDLARARSGSPGSSRPASSLLIAISDRLWPRTSWRSRAIRLRSSATASVASSWRAAWSLTLVRRSAVIAKTVIPMIETDRPWIRALAGSRVTLRVSAATTPAATISASARRSGSSMLAAVEA